MRTFKGLQWYAQRTLLGYRTFMATALEAVEDLARDPELEPARHVLAWQLEKILQADPGLQAELTKLLQASGGTQTYQAFLHGDDAIAQGGGVAAGKGGIAIGGVESPLAGICIWANRPRTGNRH